jgi:hypothetical protein
MKYTQIPANTFKQIQLNAGVLTDSFNPATGAIGNILGATTGGAAFADALEFVDFGEDIDNCPKNTKELKVLDSHTVTLSGTYVTVSADLAARLVAAGDVDESDASHVVPRNDLLPSDFKTIWWVGDYSDVNNGSDAGFIALKLMNTLSTGGFQIQSTDKGKGQFAFEYTAHYSIEDPDTVPYEIYIKEGDASTNASILLSKHSATVEENATVTITASVVPAGTAVTWTSSDDTVATVNDGVVTGEAEGNAIITASITVNGVTYTDTCTVVVTAPEA